LIAPVTKPVAPIVAAGPQRAQRRVEPRLHFDERADRRRHALLHRKPHAVRWLAQPALDLVHAHHDAVGLLALLAHLDETGERDIPGGVLQDRMRDAHGLERRNGKAGRCRGGAEQQRKRNGSRTRHECDGRNESGEYQRSPERGLMIRREIDNDAKAKTNREPRHEPAGRRVGRKPARDDLASAAERLRGRRPGNAARARDIPCPNAIALRHRRRPQPTTAPILLPVGRGWRPERVKNALVSFRGLHPEG
jgi:hypothetical protein